MPLSSFFKPFVPILLILLSAFGIALLVSDLWPLDHTPVAADEREGLWRETPWVKVDPATTHYVDSLGRVRIFHGLNVIFKQPPFVPSTEEWDVETSFSAQDAADLRRWGFNLIRLGVLWQGTFPASGASHDPAYIAAVQRIVALCEAEGIYVVMDMHSDVLNREHRAPAHRRRRHHHLKSHGSQCARQAASAATGYPTGRWTTRSRPWASSRRMATFPLPCATRWAIRPEPSPSTSARARPGPRYDLALDLGLNSTVSRP